MLDPTLDVVFKLLLTSGPDSHDVLVALLTAVLRPTVPFAKVEVRNPELDRERVGERGAVLDIAAVLEDGRLLDIEMQAAKFNGFRDRALYYWARIFGGQLDRGDAYGVLRPVVSVLLLDYVELGGTRFHSTFHLLEVHDHERWSDALEVHTIELPKLAKASAGERAEEAALVGWARFFKARTDEELEVLAMGDPALNKAKQILDRLSDDPEAQRIAWFRERALQGERIILAAERAGARTEGLAEGRTEGLAEGRAEGLAEGRAEGRSEGRSEGEASALRASIEGVCALLGVPLDDARRAHLASLDVAGLGALQAALFRDKAWPASLEAPRGA